MSSAERGHLRAGVRLEPGEPRNQDTWSPLCPHRLPRLSSQRASLSSASFHRRKQEERSPAAPSHSWVGHSTVLCRPLGSTQQHTTRDSSPATHSALVLLVLERTDSRASAHTQHAPVTTLHVMGHTLKFSAHMEHVLGAQVHAYAVSKCEDSPRASWIRDSRTGFSETVMFHLNLKNEQE